jgi:acetoin utilization protein AcuB
MNPAVATISPNDTIREGLKLLDLLEVRHLPVVEGEQLLGMVSDRDLRHFRLPAAEESKNPWYAEHLLEKKVVDAMNPEVISVSAEDDIRDAVEVMVDRKIGALAVVDNHKLMGILSYIDVLRALVGKL